MNLQPTLYVSGPISSDPSPIEEKRARFAAHADALREAGYAVVNPFDVVPACNEDPCRFGEPEPGAQDNIHSWNCFLRGDLVALLIACNGVAVLDGWEVSRGARLETDTARAVGMPILPIETWLRGECARCRQPYKAHVNGGARTGCDYAGPGSVSMCNMCNERVVWNGVVWEDGDLSTKEHMRKYCYQSKDSNPLHVPAGAGDLRS